MPARITSCLSELSRRSLIVLTMLLAACAAHSQQTPAASVADTQSSIPAPSSEPDSLPDSPSHILAQQDRQQSVVAVAKTSFATSGARPPLCRRFMWRHAPLPENSIDATPTTPLLCVNILDPYARFLDTRLSIPMTPGQKGLLALHDLADPFNFATIVGASGITIAVDPHTAYGPGWKGFGKLTGVSLLQDATGEFFGTFAIPSLVHQDPHYHRMPTARFPRRLLHAISRTVIAQHDDGTLMPNYSALLTYPIASEISNLYVPGIQSDGRSTMLRILTGYALDPVNNIVTEFVPDLAKRIHIRIIFVQQILNQVAYSPAAIEP